jgi:septum formation protein
VSQLILASTSAIRRTLLANAGLSFIAVGSGVDEDAAKAELMTRGADPRAIAGELAVLKAERVSRQMEGLVIGADQTLELDGILYDKVEDAAAARLRLALLRGRSHRLHGGLALAEGGAVVWRAIISSSLTMRDFSDAFLDDYLARNGEAALSSVGCYHLEGEGIQLFEKVEGDYFAILGLPMIELLAELRAWGIVPA